MHDAILAPFYVYIHISQFLRRLKRWIPEWRSYFRMHLFPPGWAYTFSRSRHLI